MRSAVPQCWAASGIVGLAIIKSTPVKYEFFYQVRPDTAVQVPVHFRQSEIHAQMDSSLQLFRENEFVVPETMDSWWEAFRDHAGTVPAPVRPAVVT